MEGRGRSAESGLGIFLDQQNQGARKDEGSSGNEDAESPIDVRCLEEKDEWVWPNAVSNIGIREDQSGSDGSIDAPLPIRPHQDGKPDSEQWSRAPLDEVKVEADIYSQDSSSTGSTPTVFSTRSFDPLALETARPDTPPTSTISQVIFPEVGGQRTPRAEDAGHSESKTCTDVEQTVRSVQDQRQATLHQFENDWRRMLVEDRAWLVVLLTLYMMMQQ